MRHLKACLSLRTACASQMFSNLGMCMHKTICQYLNNPFAVTIFRQNTLALAVYLNNE